MRISDDDVSISHSEPEQIIIPRTLTAEIHAAIQSVRFIAQHIKDADKDNEVSAVAIYYCWEEMTGVVRQLCEEKI